MGKTRTISNLYTLLLKTCLVISTLCIFAASLLLFILSGECSRLWGCPLQASGQIRGTRYFWTSFLSTTNVIATPTIALLGWWREKPILRHPAGYMHIRTLHSPGSNSENKSSLLKKSNWPTTKWIKTDRLVPRFTSFFRWDLRLLCYNCISHKLYMYIQRYWEQLLLTN